MHFFSQQNRIRAAVAAATLAAFARHASAHSWVDQLRVISSNGSFTGDPGYMRGYGPRNGDGPFVNLLPPDGRSPVNGEWLLPDDLMCKSTQQPYDQTDGYPRLNATAEDWIALRYQENGHVTLPWNQPGKPVNRGTVYVYGTTDPQPDDKFLSIHGQWTADGNGGDKRGRLLAMQNFDDGQCYQVNSGGISQQRQKQFPHTTAAAGADVWCQNNLQIPADVPEGEHAYTLYWVWDWPWLNLNKSEIYTSCMDLDILSANVQKSVNELEIQVQDVDNGAISYLATSTSIPNSQSSIPAYTVSTSIMTPLVVPWYGNKNSNGVVSAAPTTQSSSSAESSTQAVESSSQAAPSSTSAMTTQAFISTPSSTSIALQHAAETSQTSPSFVTVTKYATFTSLPSPSVSVSISVSTSVSVSTVTVTETISPIPTTSPSIMISPNLATTPVKTTTAAIQGADSKPSASTTIQGAVGKRNPGATPKAAPRMRFLVKPIEGFWG
ncbi:hypothetical protein L228DRAFT_245352 [Xylona heveae TC161]|uniref:DUF7492 domain-containing protein n=1 Tax=Xylona heveae (strain CBS 132557 / TC161) TaxID=1328760 RepID=A0A165I5P1_XYLHT|nr:hypothetical protein L228DRAFT_245352 [Xylona heveae TC161]KZF24422.1 hypothetical protein L228DRAFT_245352 [Xylona heveae TC161]